MQCIRDSDELFAFLQKGCGNSESNHNKIKKKNRKEAWLDLESAHLQLM